MKNNLWNRLPVVNRDRLADLFGTVIRGTGGLTSSLHDRAVWSVILTEYMIIAFTTNGQSFGVSPHRRKLLRDGIRERDRETPDVSSVCLTVKGSRGT